MIYSIYIYIYIYSECPIKLKTPLDFARRNLFTAVLSCATSPPGDEQQRYLD